MYTFRVILILFIGLLVGCGPSELITEEGVIYRGNLERSGVYSTDGVRQPGGERWRYYTGDPIYTYAPISNGVVYFISDNPSGSHLHAVDIVSGQELWRYGLAITVMDTYPTLANGTVYFGQGNIVYALDAQTGRERWTLPTETDQNSSISVMDGILYISSANGYTAIDADDRRVLWEFTTQDFVFFPAFYDGMMIFGCLDGNLYAIDSRHGNEVWRFNTAGAIITTPAVANGVVFFGSHDYFFYALDVVTGQELWKFDTDNIILTSAAAINDKVYFGDNNGFFYALDTGTGNVIWRFGRVGSISSSPSIADDIIYFSSMDRHLYAVDINTGEMLWNYSPTGEVDAPVSIFEGVIYFGSRGGFLYAIQDASLIEP